MNRPSRTFFLRTLRAWLSKRHYQTALDAASAAFKYASLIQAERYVGVDLNFELLAQGAARVQSGVGILGDVRRAIQCLPESSIDLCVSTHTISHLEIDHVVPFIDLLWGANAPAGDLVFNMSRVDFNALNLRRLLVPRYSDVSVITYRKPWTLIFERGSEDAHGVFDPGWLGSLVVRSKALVAFEHVTARLNLGDTVLVLCRSARKSTRNQLTFSSLTELIPRIYSADDCLPAVTESSSSIRNE